MNDSFEKMLATFAVLAAGCYCMSVTNGSTGIGWAMLGMFFIWAA